jgi:hypothetical protein
MLQPYSHVMVVSTTIDEHVDVVVVVVVEEAVVAVVVVLVVVVVVVSSSRSRSSPMCLPYPLPKVPLIGVGDGNYSFTSTAFLLFRITLCQGNFLYVAEWSKVGKHQRLPVNPLCLGIQASATFNIGGYLTPCVAARMNERCVPFDLDPLPHCSQRSGGALMSTTSL